MHIYSNHISYRFNYLHHTQSTETFPWNNEYDLVCNCIAMIPPDTYSFASELFSWSLLNEYVEPTESLLFSSYKNRSPLFVEPEVLPPLLFPLLLKKGPDSKKNCLLTASRSKFSMLNIFRRRWTLRNATFALKC